MSQRLYAGTLAELREHGRLVAGDKRLPVCVFLDEDGAPHALDDRCPHMGSLLHLGEVRNDLVVCHWHDARFEIATGKSLDEFVDDVPSFATEIDGDAVYVILP